MKRKLISVLIVLAISACGVAFAQNAPAADAAPADAPAVAPKKPEATTKTLGDYWRAGGWTMYPLALCAIAGISLSVVNGLSIRGKKFYPKAEVEQLTALLNEKKVDEALALCESKSSPLANIVGAGLARVNDQELDMDAIEEAMGEASIEEMASPYMMINYLALISSISPMLGLFGTVLGMVKAFDTIAAEGTGNAQRLADNISEALITTATGMIIGVPTMLAYFIFKSIYAKVTSSISRIVGDILFTYKVSSKFGPQDLGDSSQSSIES